MGCVAMVGALAVGASGGARLKVADLTGAWIEVVADGRTSEIKPRDPGARAQLAHVIDDRGAEVHHDGIRLPRSPHTPSAATFRGKWGVSCCARYSGVGSFPILPVARPK
jgi:hypothetical protein